MLRYRRKTYYHIVSSMTLLLLQISYAEKMSNVTVITAKLGENVTMPCDGIRFFDRRWNYNGNDTLFHNTLDIATKFRGELRLNHDNYSLTVTLVDREHQGEYACLVDSVRANVFLLIIEETPKMFIETLGKIHFTEDGASSNSIYINAKDGTLNAVCYAIDARPAVSLTWTVNDVAVNASVIKHEPIKRGKYSYTNTTSELSVFLLGKSGKITCTSQMKYRSENTSVVIHYNLYVCPNMTLTIDGMSINGSVAVVDGYAEATCHITAANMSSNRLFWKFDDVQLDVLEETISGDTDGRFVEGIRAKIYPRTGRGNIACIYRGIGDCRIQENVTLITEEKETLGYVLEVLHRPLFYVVIAATVTALTLFGLIGLLVKKKYCGSVDIETQDNSDVSIRRLSSTKRSLKYLRTIERVQRATNPPRIALPELPSGSVCSETGNEDEDEVESVYSLSKLEPTEERMFRDDDICRIYNLRLGPLYNRWIGSMTLPNQSKKHIVISTVTGSALTGGGIHWDQYVTRALDLPDLDNLVKIAGICIDSMNLYLISEHLTCNTLDERLCRTNKLEGKFSRRLSRMFSDDRTTYIVGILRGMNVIQSYGFLHPALSTKKILTTKKGICKLYDFCLAKDAPHVAKIKMSKVTNSFNSFSPETWLRTEYTSASDVWATAVVIWQVLSHGFQPFTDNDVVSTENAAPIKLPDAWDEINGHKGGSIFRDCWHVNAAKRPSINHLRDSFLA